LEAAVDELLEPVDHVGIDALLEERHVAAALVEHGAKDILQERLREVDVIAELRERDLRFDHPELGQMATRVGVLRAERWPKRVHPRERATVGLERQLTGHRKEGRLPEELPRLRFFTRRRGSTLGGDPIQGRDAKHLACALAVTARDD